MDGESVKRQEVCSIEDANQVPLTVNEGNRLERCRTALGS